MRVLNPPPESGSDIPALPVDLRRTGLGKLLAGLPPWARTVVLVAAFGAGSGASLAGASKWLGLETTKDADAREARILDRVTRGESRVTELEQSRRKEGLSKRARADVAAAVAEALAASPLKAPKRKPKPVQREPVEAEDESP